MSSGATLVVLTPAGNEPPASNYAVLNLRNNHPILCFDDTTAEYAVWTSIIPRNYSGGGLTVYVHWVAVATSGNGGWLLDIERLAAGGQDIDSDGFDSSNPMGPDTVPNTSGVVIVSSAALGNIDSVAAGDLFRIRIVRDVGGDTAVGDLQLLGVEIKET